MIDDLTFCIPHPFVSSSNTDCGARAERGRARRTLPKSTTPARTSREVRRGRSARGSGRGFRQPAAAEWVRNQIQLVVGSYGKLLPGNLHALTNWPSSLGGSGCSGLGLGVGTSILNVKRTEQQGLVRAACSNTVGAQGELPW